MAFIGRTTATRGTLLRLKTTCKFVQNAMEILKMKRDRLAANLNELLNQLGCRDIAEQNLMEIYSEVKMSLANLGYSVVSSTASSIPRLNAEVEPISIMGVNVPKVTIKEKPRLQTIENMSLYNIAEKQRKLIEELLKVAEIEAGIERIAYDLMGISRKVNALEKVIIPTYSKHIRYIEDLLFDEDLEDFARIKHIKVLAERKKK
jgi:V/A-type H+-transporting ATPase subunit D